MKPCKDCGSTIKGHHHFIINTAKPTPELKSMMARLKIGEDTKSMSTLNAIARFFESPEFARHMKREYDRSFDVTVEEKEGKVKLQFAEKDSGHAIMTVADVAVLLQTDRASVRRMTGDRAQHRSHHPIPFVKVGGKMIRFSRPAIEAWWAELCVSRNGKSNTSALTLTKGKVKKP
jgi:predicted DNA-binding transcriptional regulator AlpA